MAVDRDGFRLIVFFFSIRITRVHTRVPDREYTACVAFNHFMDNLQPRPGDRLVASRIFDSDLDALASLH